VPAWSIVPVIASFHLTTVRRAAAPIGLARLGTDRLRLGRVDGVRFWRLLGTGRGSDTGPGVDLRRTARFALWDDEAALDRFLVSRLARHAGTEEQYVVRMTAIGGHGRWNGFDVVGAFEPSTPSNGPIAVVTRARVHPKHWRTFAAASRPVSRELQGARGLLAVCGIGEAPVGRQATFSMWRSPDDARNYAYGAELHRAVMSRTRAEGWYGEELFATFAIVGATGTWGGRDPLAGVIQQSS
jgi:hypothetical protein